MALLHYPVLNKRGEVVASAVTNLDIHDIARAARTYNVKRYYIVTPLEDQGRLTRRIVSYWTEGAGAAYNPQRADALSLVTVQTDLDAVREDIRRSGGKDPLLVVTSARCREDAVGFAFVRQLLTENSLLLVFGTAWGLDESVLAGADFILDAVQEKSDYNHLSVRSAVSIILDRLIRSDIL